MLNIATFGSCLSRSVANSYRRLYGARILSTIKHNRIDQFYHYYVEGVDNLPPREWLKEHLVQAIEVSDKRATPEQVFNNQYPDGLGKHLLDTEKNFLEVLESEKIDIIIIDNFMDIAAKVLYPLIDEFANSPIFLRTSDFVNITDHMRVDGYLLPEKATNYWQKTLDFFLSKQVGTKVFFICFPYNTSQNRERQKRAIGFSEAFEYKDAKIIPSLEISERCQVPNEWAHFTKDVYHAWAGAIYYDALYA